ncbi:MAG: FadR family transcriptional regulator, partial [Syntrophobacteraceae bacterium]|nr:FadR family transcriptional regulator [Syntrophobacteraceae bacterium]
EPQVAALAAKRITGGELDRLKVIVCDQQRKMLAGKEDSRLDIAFHAAVADASKNGIVRQVMKTVDAIINESRSAHLQSDARRRASVEGHLKLIDALETRDSEMACKAMKEHLSQVEGIILGLLESRSEEESKVVKENCQ